MTAREYAPLRVSRSFVKKNQGQHTYFVNKYTVPLRSTSELNGHLLPE